MSRISASTLLLTIFVAVASYTNAFAPSSTLNRIPAATTASSTTSIHMGFGMPDEETKSLTRENEPDEYFSTNMDKMSDAEKLPVAIGGFVVICLPFVAGLIALYAAK
mmetsp:Transcript_1747/g.2514  ORF Transcript_1747/g.2514 Transcript_1747/m.2514 type:complete len:108 (+) Transcript_1747:184-507(+)|eukprot:CAMPEP_0203650248 /NCGR_PEP_ID=MMETSP0088-20131115/24154_1 /ASSEMBLY_ACC=CAM_ASM_001087 /TAXON_ID=426623 /ORGANISM="Chaetoceros affinis, Strain CCMP159" /LENGTH=107 /DNA_ID=CAMNT_0050508943 /DNA_START=49 /DNA_END=372 /DNA_ORIENTATION=-